MQKWLILSTFKFTMSADDWITQAEAARLRKVTPQAIGKLVAAGRLRTTRFGGRVFVSRKDVVNFKELPRGRPAKER